MIQILDGRDTEVSQDSDLLPGFKLDHSLSAFLVHDAMATLAATYWLSRLNFICRAAVSAVVVHGFFGSNKPRAIASALRRVTVLRLLT